jgi:hypothetical protein
MISAKKYQKREKQEKKEQIIAYLGKILKQQEEDEGFRIAKAADQLEKKLELEHMEKVRKTKENYEEIRKHREETVSYALCVKGKRLLGFG